MSKAKQKARRNRRKALIKAGGVAVLERPLTSEERTAAEYAYRQDQRQRAGGEGLVVLSRRCRYMGWNGGPDSIKRAKSPLLATLHGQLAYTKLIRQSAYDGLERYLTADAAYRRAIDAPAPTAKAVDLSASSGRAPGGERASVVRAAVSEWMRMQGALQAGRVDTILMARVLRDEIEGDTFAERKDAVGEAGIAAIAHAGKVLCDCFGLATEKP